MEVPVETGGHVEDSSVETAPIDHWGYGLRGGHCGDGWAIAEQRLKSEAVELKRPVADRRQRRSEWFRWKKSEQQAPLRRAYEPRDSCRLA